jgi:predicted Fe-S protein YdhL (DUF1289 family)
MIDQGEMFEIANPCRGICEVNNKGYCKGCLRKREERFHWNEFTPFQKQLIVNLCGRRRAKALAARQQAEWLAQQGNSNDAEALSTTGLSHATSVVPQLDMFITDDSADDIRQAQPTDVNDPVSLDTHTSEQQAAVATTKTETETETDTETAADGTPEPDDANNHIDSLFDSPDTDQAQQPAKPVSSPRRKTPSKVISQPDQFDLF